MLKRLMEILETALALFARLVEALEAQAKAATVMAFPLHTAPDADASRGTTAEVNAQPEIPGVKSVTGPFAPIPPAVAAPAAPDPAPAQPAAPACAPAAETPPATPPVQAPVHHTVDGWNPFTEEVKGRYGVRKQNLLRELLLAHGIEVPNSWTGQQLHLKLRELGPVTPVASAPAAPMAPAAPAAPMAPAAPAAPMAPAAPAAPMAPAAPAAPMAPAAPAQDAPSTDVVFGLLRKIYALGPEWGKAAAAVLQEEAGVNRLTDPATGASLVPAEKLPAIYTKALALAAQAGI